MSNDQPSRRPPAKSSGGGAPMGSTVSIMIAVIAVVVGFLILRNITSDSGGSSGGSNQPSVTTTTQPNSSNTTTTTTLAATPTTITLVKVGATVLVANASGKSGAATQFLASLKQFGFTTAAKGTNATGVDARLTTSKVYYVATPPNPTTLAVANSVAQSMGSGIQVLTMPTPIPVDGADLSGATVLVMLGTDLAGNPLAALSPGTTTTLPGAPIGGITSTSAA